MSVEEVDIISCQAICTRRRFSTRFAYSLEWSFSPGVDIALEHKENLAHPTRFERVTFAFGGQTSRLPTAGQHFPPIARIECCGPRNAIGGFALANLRTHATILRTHSGPSCRWLRMIPSLGTISV